jgi:hypothetical protein
MTLGGVAVLCMHIRAPVAHACNPSLQTYVGVRGRAQLCYRSHIYPYPNPDLNPNPNPNHHHSLTPARPLFAPAHSQGEELVDVETGAPCVVLSKVPTSLAAPQQADNLPQQQGEEHYNVELLTRPRALGGVATGQYRQLPFSGLKRPEPLQGAVAALSHDVMRSWLETVAYAEPVSVSASGGGYWDASGCRSTHVCMCLSGRNG